jgi:hypothetical protein
VITDLDWIITETHLYVGKNDPNTLTTAPGQFPYDDGDASGVPDTMVTYVIPLAAIDEYEMERNKKGKETGKMVALDNPGVVPCNDIFIAAHAVVSTQPRCESEAFIFGVEQYTGDLWLVDALGGTSTLYADIVDPVPDNINSPNGLAYDSANDRLYYSVMESGSDTSSEIWFWDGATATVKYAGELPSPIAGATIYDGEYYYIANNSDGDLYKAWFNTDGTILNWAPLKDNFSGNSGETYRFGDEVVYPDISTMYCSTTNSAIPAQFFSLDMTDYAYTQISTTPNEGLNLQLAIGSDGLLYGQPTGSGEFFIVDPATGKQTSVGTPLGADYGFTDLASGSRCIPDYETAWGFGTDFDHPNWAMYFSYHIQGQETDPIILIVTRMSQPQSGADRDTILAELAAAGYTNLVSIDEPSGGLTQADIDTYNPGVVIYNTWSYPSTSNATPSTLIAWFNNGGNLIINGDDVSRVEAGGSHPYQTPHPTYNNNFGVIGSWEELTRLDYQNNGGSYERGVVNGYQITLGSGHPVLAGIEGQTFTYYIDPDSTNFWSTTGATSLATATPNSPNPDSFAGGPCITAYDATAGGKGKLVTIGLAFYNGYYVPSGHNTVPAIPSSIAQTLLDNTINWVSN